MSKRNRVAMPGTPEAFQAFSTAWADGLIDNPAGTAIGKGDTVRFLPYSVLLS